MAKRFLPLLTALLLLLPPVAHAQSGPPVLAIYFAWFDNATWTGGQTSDLPATPYNSDDRATIQRQVTQAQSAGIDGFELNWWGPGNRTDTNLQTLLAVAQGTSFKVSAYVDLNGPDFNSPGDVITALTYLQHDFTNPAWFQFQGKPFVAFYNVAKFDVPTWNAIFAQVDPGRQTFWMGEGVNFDYLNVFDGIHPFSLAWSPNPAAQQAAFAAKAAAHPGKTYMATVMPGYDDTRLGRGAAGFAVDRQGGAYYTSSWQGAVAVKPAIISITSWNEWLEGSQIEPSQSYGDFYLEITKEQSAAYKLAMNGSPASP